MAATLMKSVWGFVAVLGFLDWIGLDFETESHYAALVVISEITET